ncbi:MFS transporter [Nonomuraea sp. ZG12]|uniref:MFS transporter n=1 Tax=Nonomuraea sp. ZG12 TaxID=3452207 RepID=UPI003F8B0652
MRVLVKDSAEPVSTAYGQARDSLWISDRIRDGTQWGRRTTDSVALAGRPVLVAPSSLRLPALRIGLLMAVLLFAGYGAFSYEYSMFTQVGLGLTPVQSGLVLAVFAGTFVLAGLRMPHITARFGERTMEVAAGLLAAGLIMLGLTSRFTQGKGAAVWIGCFQVIGVLLGAAQASQYGPLVATVMAAVPHQVAGLAGGLFTTAQQATIGAIPGALAPSLGWEHAFAVGLGVQVVTTVLFWVLARRLRRRPRGSDAHRALGVRRRTETID